MAHRYGLNKTLGSAIGAIALVVLISSSIAFAVLRQVRVANDLRDRSTGILTALDGFRAQMLNQETGVRAYLITGRQENLDPYREGKAAFDKNVMTLRQLTGGDPEQTALIEQAEASARDWQVKIGEAMIHDIDSGARAASAALESTGSGKSLFDAFRANLSSIEIHEQRSLAVQNARVAEAERNAVLALAAGALVTLAICAGIAAAIDRMIAQPLVTLAGVMGRLVRRDMSAQVPRLEQRNEVGDMARAVRVFKESLIELDRTALLRVTADTLPAMVGYIDNDRRIGFLNSEFSRWFDLDVADVAEVQGRPLAQVFQAKALPGMPDQLDAALAGTEARFEGPLTLRSGEKRDVETYFRPHRAPDHKVLGAVVLLTDITGRKEADRRLTEQAQELVRSNEELEQFAYVASHDLKAPLRGIDNLVSWIEEDLEGVLSGETRTNMDLLKSRVHRLESLLDDLLAYSRAGRDDLVLDTVDTKHLVEELAQLVSPPEGFRIIAGDSLPALQTARAPLTQALQNLIGNAIKHHDRPHDGEVRVEAQDRGAVIEFTVADNGPGIPERYRSRVFGMFQTLRPRDEVEGSGMGLAIVKKLTERQNGAVWLTDTRSGSGLTVHFTWPTRRDGPFHPKRSLHGAHG